MTLDTQSLTVIGALAGGIVTSLHCMAMCGPLACGMMAFQRDTSARLTAGVSYHCSRLLSYSLVGGICGGIGASPLSWFFDSPMQLFPWAVGLLLLAFALCGGKLKFQIPILTRLIYSVRSRLGVRQRSPLAAGLALGFTAPLLPCGPLYILFGACLFSGSFLNGLTFGLAFGLGTVPALWIAHQSLASLQRRLGSRFIEGTRRFVALSAALMIFIRMSGTLVTPATAQTELDEAGQPVEIVSQNQNSLPTCPLCK